MWMCYIEFNGMRLRYIAYKNSIVLVESKVIWFTRGQTLKTFENMISLGWNRDIYVIRATSGEQAEFYCIEVIEISMHLCILPINEVGKFLNLIIMPTSSSML